MLHQFKFTHCFLILSLAALCACHSNPSNPNSTPNSTGNKDTLGFSYFRIIANHDTLDRAQFQDDCWAEADYNPEPGLTSLDLDFFFSRTGLNGPDLVQFDVNGFVTGPTPGSYPITAFQSSGGGFQGFLDSSVLSFSSLNGGTITITKFDTVNNLVSGTIKMTAAKRQPNPDPTDIDSIFVTFNNIGNIRQMFGQGSFTATTDGIPFQPSSSGILNLEVYSRPGTGILKIDGSHITDTGQAELTIELDSPHVGTIPFGSANAPGTAEIDFEVAHAYYTSDFITNCGSITITAYDPINRRISGTFSAVVPNFGTQDTIPITNGVINNLTWVRE